MKLTRIGTLYASNLLTGLVFWYGIEKLFMGSIGITAVGIGTATAVYIIFNLLFDIPMGVIADRWSRKWVLVISAVSLGISSFLLGSSHSLLQYSVGEVFYGLYIVSTSGVYSALIYDILHEEGRTASYSKISGRAYALFLAGAGIANVASGFLAQQYSYRMTFFVTIVTCVLNALLLATLHEPTFHKAAKKERVLSELTDVSRAIAKIRLVRVLTIVLSVLAVAELFKSEFGQLYMLRYFSAPQIIGLLWAAYAFTWSLGSLIAHRLRAHLHLLITCTTAPFIVMAVIDNWVSLILFMLQAVAAAALINQIETRIQEATPSGVRASILSVVATLGRAVSVPASFALGWLFHTHGALTAERAVAVVAAAVLLYWLYATRMLTRLPGPATADSVRK